MSKYEVGVGEEFPLGEGQPQPDCGRHRHRHHRHHRHHGHHHHGAGDHHHGHHGMHAPAEVRESE